MDEKTLQYMGERVDKAREIKKKIWELKNFIKYSDEKKRCRTKSEWPRACPN